MNVNCKPLQPFNESINHGYNIFVAIDDYDSYINSALSRKLTETLTEELRNINDLLNTFLSELYLLLLEYFLSNYQASILRGILQLMKILLIYMALLQNYHNDFQTLKKNLLFRII